MPAEAINIINKHLKIFFSITHNPLIDRRNGLWELNPMCGYNTSDGKGEYVIYNFPVKDELENEISAYPIYISISVLLKENNDISRIGIKIFKDDIKQASAADYRPTELLLRSEWDNAAQENDNLQNHAQPHWHIHAYEVDDLFISINPKTRKTILELIDEEVMQNKITSVNSIMDEGDVLDIPTQEQNNKSGEFPMFKFHLAMVADWDINTNSHNKTLDCPKLEKWLPQCLSYIKHQVEYILGRLPV